MSQLKRKIKEMYKKNGALAFHYYAYSTICEDATDYEMYFAEKLGRYCQKSRSLNEK